jgi:hypothetical protein
VAASQIVTSQTGVAASQIVTSQTGVAASQIVPHLTVPHLRLLRNPWALRVSRQEASARLTERLRAGTQLLERSPRTWFDLAQLTQDYQHWSGENRDLLRALFTGDAAGFEYSAFHGRPPTPGEDLAARARRLRDDVGTKLARLSAIAARIVRRRGADVPMETPPGGAPAPPAPVALAHGGDDATAAPVAQLLARLGVEIASGDAAAPVAREPLPEPMVGHAVVVLTAPPALLDLGYFLGALGRSAVTVLRGDAGALPPELTGVFSVPLDPGGAWKLWLARDLRHAGYPVDATGLLAD